LFSQLNAQLVVTLMTLISVFVSDVVTREGL